MPQFVYIRSQNLAMVPFLEIGEHETDSEGLHRLLCWVDPGPEYSARFTRERPPADTPPFEEFDRSTAPYPPGITGNDPKRTSE